MKARGSQRSLCSGWAAGVALLLVVLATVGSARAQESAESDSSATDRMNPMVRASRMAEANLDSTELAALQDSITAAYTDSLIAANSGFDWYTSFKPVLTADVNSDVNRVAVSGDVTGSLTWLDGARSTVSYGGSNTSYRQQDRDQIATSLAAGLQDSLFGGSKLQINFQRNTNEDTNRLTTGDKVVIDFASNNADLSLKGSHDAGEQLRHAWQVRGDFEDVNQENRGTNNDRNLASGGATSLWKLEREKWNVTGRVGVLASTGTRQLRGEEADASALRDTLGADFSYSLGRRFTLDARGELVGFEEKRLDFARNASGVIDTLGAAVPVGQETEKENSNLLRVNVKTSPLPRTTVGANASHSFSETTFDFSKQGLIQNGREELGGDASFRYAASGSVKVNYKFTDAWNDRRTAEGTVFRGRESRESEEVGLKLNQKVLRATDFEVLAKQTLSRNIFGASTNNNDRDRLVERFDGTLRSTAVPRLTMNAGATISTTREVNIAAERVANNKDDRLFEVRGGYIYKPVTGLTLSQNYRLQILFIDYHGSNDRDQFNKQGQLRNEIDVDLPSGSIFEMEYSVDFRKTGERDLDEPFRTIYLPDQRRFDHQISAAITIPWRWIQATVNTQRGFLREERGGRDTEEDRGRISIRLSGDHEFWGERGDRVTLSVDVERVLQFGPRVREEQEDYFVANSGVVVRF